jgi:hypothetical protein
LDQEPDDLKSRIRIKKMSDPDKKAYGCSTLFTGNCRNYRREYKQKKHAKQEELDVLYIYSV